MRFDRWAFRRFGPFEDWQLDLSDGREGFHLIFGQNEAGKSSALRGLKQLLFQIEARTEDAWQFSADQMRLAATLRTKDGKTLDIVRRKTRPNDLRAGDDVTPIPESVLRSLLGATDRETFWSVHGIDADRLRAGGRALAQADGEVGSILMTARSGLARLNSLRQSLVDESETIFKPKGRSQIITTAVKQYRLKLKQAGTVALHEDTWQRERNDLEQARRDAQDLSARLSSTRERSARLQRYRQAQPILARLDAARREALALADVPVLDETFSDRRRQAVADRDQARALRDHHDDVIRQRTEAEQAIVVDEALLARADDIQQLRDDRNIHTKAGRDVVELERRLAGLTDSLVEMRRQLGLSNDVTDRELDRLRPPAEIARTLERMLEDLTRIDERAQSLARDRRSLQTRVLKLADAEGTIGALGDVIPLRHAIAQSRRWADETQTDEADRVARQKRTQADLLLRQLGGFAGSLDELERRAYPDAAAVDERGKTLEEARQRLQLAQRRWGEVNAQRDRSVRTVQALESQKGRLTQESLDAARQRRDEAWRLIQGDWLGPPIDPTTIASWLKETNHPSLAGAFESLVREADRIADDLRQHADLSARIEQAARMVLDLDEEVRRATTERADAESAESAARQHWHALFAETLWSPESVRQAGIFAQQRAEILALLRDARELADAAQHGRDSRQQACQTLRQALAAVGIDVAESAPLTTLLDRADAWMSDQEDRAQQRRLLQQRREELANDKRTLESDESALASEREAWNVDWKALAQRLGRPEQASVQETSQSVRLMETFLVHRRESAQLAERISAIRRDATTYEEQIRQFANDMGGDDRPLDVWLRDVQSRLVDAQSAHRNREEHRRHRDESLAAWQTAQEKFQLADARLRGLCEEAGVDEPDALPSLEEQNSRLRDWRRIINESTESLRSIACSDDFDEFLAEARLLPTDTLAADIQQHQELVERLEQDLHTALDRAASARAHLEQLEKGGAEAAETLDDAEDLLARLQENARQYALLRAAYWALEVGIERYRSQHQSPVLEQACRLFQQLTIGSFAGLDVQFGDKARQEIVALRPDGRPVPISALSDGARDQLFLALRLATLEESASQPQAEPIPFIVDDLLLTFDDRRASAALKALADFSTHTQVLFFTHHRHLVELARQAIPADRLFVHELSPLDSPKRRRQSSTPKLSPELF
jgi:uncharacterized protein YhaN